MYLRERDLAATLKVSRTPVREALRQLERDGFVRLIPHVGAQVQEVSLQDLFEILEMRRCLEPYAARLAARKVTPAIAQKLRGFQKEFEEIGQQTPGPATIRRHIASDRQLHGLILELAENRRIAQVIAQLGDVIQRYRYLGFETPNRLPKSTREHLAVIDALLRRDPAAAEAGMDHHLEQFTEDMKDVFLSRLLQRGSDGRRIPARRKRGPNDGKSRAPPSDCTRS
jgi:DNA-binding GntR family transcriptional regulator